MSFSEDEHLLSEDEDFLPFAWATRAELNCQSISILIGKRVQIKEYMINVLSCLGVGRTGPTFKVAVLEPENQSGVLMALQFRQGQEAIEPLERAAAIFRKMDENDPVPHTVRMKAFGPLWVPRKPLFGCINLQPPQSYNGKGLLMTLARGSPLKQIAFDRDADKTTFKQQLAEFAESMYSKGLVHGDLTSENIYWHPESRKATVIDFGNAVDKHAPNILVAQRAALKTRKDALHEMVRFLGDTFGFEKLRAQSVAQSDLDGADKKEIVGIGPNQLDARAKLRLLASGDDERSTNIDGNSNNVHEKHEV